MKNSTASKITNKINKLSDIWQKGSESEAQQAKVDFNELCKKYSNAKPFKAWFCSAAKGAQR